MMKVKDAKRHCGYDPKPVFHVCGNCGAFISTFKKYDLGFSGEAYSEEKNLRCLDHGFAVKKQATCKLWRPKPEGDTA
jgi:hypothetical protein